MTYAALATGTHLVVGDGKKDLILVNEGTAFLPVLTVEEVLRQSNPQNHDLGTDRLDRVYSSAGRHTGSPEPVDWHQLNEDRFADEILVGLLELAKHEKLKRLVIIAPPRTLAELRHAMPEELKKLIIAEIHKDLTKHTIKEITHHVMEELSA